MPRLSVWMIRAALLHLGTGILLGALLLFDKGIPLNLPVGRLLTPHIEMLLMGGLLQLAMGTAVWIVPRFTGPQRYGRIRLAWLAFGLFNAGIALYILGEGWHPVSIVGRGMELGAGVLFALYIRPRIKPMATGLPPGHLS